MCINIWAILYTYICTHYEHGVDTTDTNGHAVLRTSFPTYPINILCSFRNATRNKRIC